MSKLGTVITIHLVDGAPDGLRLVRTSNWNGEALVAPRSLYSKIRTRPDLQRPAVYVLCGMSETTPGRHRLYIGQTDCAADRIDRQIKKLDWWESLIVFTSTDATLNRAYVKHLEARLFDIASSVKRAQLEYGQTPTLPSLSTAEVAIVEGFLANMLLVYPILGISAFEKVESGVPLSDEYPILALSGKGAEAEGRDLPGGFVVYAGARARRDAVQSIHPYLDSVRTELISEGVLEDEDKSLRLTQDYTFSSPSNAAGVLLGRSANGRKEWRDQSGKTLKDIQEASLPASLCGEESE